MKTLTKILALILAALLAISLGACGGPKVPNGGKTTEKPDSGKTETTNAQSGTAETPEPSQTDPAVPTEQPFDRPYTTVSLKDAKAGDVIVFGSYEQDGDASNGKEPLEWLVLANDGGSLFVITLYAIEHMQFHSSLAKVTWETSAVRAWLNNDFIASAFSPSESSKIKLSTVIAEKNPDYPNSPAGNDTEDKVFLLSVQEVGTYFKDGASRKCAPTKAVIAGSNVFSRSNKAWYADHDYLCGWWLRSPGMYKDLYVSYVNHSGSASAGGQVYLSGTDICVRPAMWITVE